MASTSEVGHAKNVANFEDLIEFVNSYGTNYNPSKRALQSNELNSLLEKAKLKLNGVIVQNTAFNNAVNERATAFSNVRKLSTRLINALEVTDASEKTVKDAKGFNQKIQGKRANTTPKPVDPDAPAPKTISTSQQSFDQIIQHLTGLKEVLRAESSYSPNEVELQVRTINDKIEALDRSNKLVAAAFTSISNTRIDRNETLYNSQDALTTVAQEVKKYIKSVYGATSPQYKQVSGISFRKVNT